MTAPQPDKQRIIRIVGRLLERSGLRIEQVIARMQVQQCEISRAGFENRFTTRAHLKPNIPPPMLLALIGAFTEGLLSHERCTAAEAIELAVLARLPLDQLRALSRFFPPAEFAAAYSQYAPLLDAAPESERRLRRADWGPAPDVATLYGRQAELSRLTQ